MIPARLRRRRRPHGERDTPDEEVLDVDPGELIGAFTTPRWLRDVGLTSWLLVGVTVLLLGAVWLMSLTHTIVMPVITAAVVAAVAAPLLRWLQAHGVGRGLGTILLVLAAVALGALVFWMVVRGITSETDDLRTELSDAKDTLEGWLEDLGVDPTDAENAEDDASAASTKTVSTLVHGVASGIEELSSLVFFLAMTLLSLVFLLKDGPTIRSWGERHLGVPVPVARTISERVMQSLRGYFLGVTIVAAFNALVVVVGALILGVPLAASIALVTFLGAYVPYLGAWTAGAFAVLVALGGAGTDAAIGMIVVQLLANSVLQQLIQPIAYGAALGIHPLAVLVVTIGGGCLFGAVGLILAAPLTAAATRIATDLGRARIKEAEEETEPSPEGASPAAHPT